MSDRHFVVCYMLLPDSHTDMDGLTTLFENLAALSPHHKFIDKTTL